jgi:hypothetical protein
MMAYGINIKDKRDKSAQQLRKEMVGPHCPFCHTVNIPDSQLCSSCYKPPTSVSYNKIMQEAEESKKKLQEIASLQEKQQAALEVMSVWANRMDVMSKQLEQAKAEIPRLSKNRR